MSKVTLSLLRQCVRDLAMAEFMRSITIVVMGLTVIGAGVFVVFYG